MSAHSKRRPSASTPDEHRAVVERGFPKWFSGQQKHHESLTKGADGRAIPVEIRGSASQFGDRPAELLNVIIGSSDLAMRDLDPHHPPGCHIHQVHKAAERAAGLTRQLLAFSRRQVLSPKDLDLNALLADLSKMLRRLIREDITLEIVPGADLGCVRADPGQIEQVILDMAVNARDAMPSAGRLTIRTNNLTAPENGDLPAGECVMTSITDMGTGMTDEVKERLFEPFFTTKTVGKGTGHRTGLPSVVRR